MNEISSQNNFSLIFGSKNKLTIPQKYNRICIILPIELLLLNIGWKIDH